MDMKQIWRDKHSEWYETKYQGKPKLWRYIQDFIFSNEIKSILEVGGGTGYVSMLVPRYVCVEVNETAIREGKATSQCRVPSF